MHGEGDPARGHACQYVNTCYRDSVNPLLRAADVLITTGVGNIGNFLA